MLKLVATNDDTGRRLLLLGLSEDNLARLRAGQPIRVHGEEMGLPDRDIVICYGRTEHDLMETFLPLTDKRTVIHIDPRTV